MKYIIFLGDGMADFPIPELGNRTPLQVAEKPNMDRIAREGRCGRFVTVEDDMPPGSEVANLTVLGYDPHQCHQGRGVIEAASMGIALSDADVALRCNLITIHDGRIKNHSAGHIPSEEAAELIRTIDSNLGSRNVRFYPGVSYRHLLVLSAGAIPTESGLSTRSRSGRFSDEGSIRLSTDLECAPPHDHVGESAADLLAKPRTAEAEPTAALLNELTIRSWNILPKHSVNQRRVAAGKDSANSIWPWSPGRRPRMKTFRELYGFTGAVISAVDLVRGIGVHAGLDVIQVEGATGLIDTNYEGKADACIAALESHDFVYVHVEAPDEASHARDLGQKIKAIEYLDRRLIGRVLKALDDSGIQATVAVLPDHPTPVATGNHVRGAVPVAISVPGVAPDRIATFDEDAVGSGALGLLRGKEFFETFLGRR